MNEATGISGERLRKAMAEGEAKINADIYNEESLRELLAERVVIICEYYSILYLTSKMCKTTKNFFHVSHETMREIRISIVVGGFYFQFYSYSDRLNKYPCLIVASSSFNLKAAISSRI